MSVATNEVVPGAAGGGPGPPGGATSRPAGSGTEAGAAQALLRPRESCPRTTPTRARRMDRRPGPRLRPLSDVLAEHAGPPGAVGSSVPGTAPRSWATAWDAALDTAAAQVGPLAVGLLTATAEVLDGRRPLDHLAVLCPWPVIDGVRAGLARANDGFPRGARVRGLRLCPVVGVPGPDGRPGLAVEVAAALCGDRGSRARAAAARFELDGTGIWRVAELTVL